MAVKYLDFENGNDSLDGSTFANRWKTINSGATSARVNPGDEVRVMASAYETLIGSAAWTYMSKLITLPSAVAANISDCEAAWTPATNVTSTTDGGTFKEGTKSVNITSNGSFTTGLLAYKNFAFTVAALASGDIGASYVASNALDGNINTQWNSSVSYGNTYWSAIFSSARVVSGYTITARNDSFIGDSPTSWNVQGSNDDGATWATIQGQTSPATWTPGLQRSFTITSPASYKRIRFVFLATQGNSTNVAMAEVGFTYSDATPSTLDLSAYQQVSFWLYNAQAIADGATLSLRLCSDTAGATTVNTVPIPAISGTGILVPITVDLGAALGSNIQSVALYADKAWTSKTVLLDNIIACKASSAADSLSLTSMIGKAHNVGWAASTAYALNDVRKPTTPNRTGYCYRATTAGTTGATEPVWPQEIGVTVTDGTVVWTCLDVEETWYCIQSINGTSVRIDNWNNTMGNAGRGYGGATETVATYKREPIKLAMGTGFQFQKSGTDALPILYSGGWDRTSMSTQNGETWVTGQNGSQGGQQCLFYVPVIFNVLSHFGIVRSQTGISIGNGPNTLNFCHLNHHQGNGFTFNGPVAGCHVRSRGLITNNNNGYGEWLANYGAQHTSERFASLCNNSDGIRVESNWPMRFKGVVGRVKNNAGNSFTYNSVGLTPELVNVITANNVGGAIAAATGLVASKCIFGEGDPTPAAGNGGNGNPDRYVYLQNYNQVAGAHKAIGEGGVIASATDRRAVASGVSWKFSPTSSIRHSLNPLKMSIMKLDCAANVPVSVTLMTNRDNTNVKGQIIVLGGQVAGIPSDIKVDCQPTINTWVESGALTFTPTEDAVVEVFFHVWDGVGTTNNFWIQKPTVT